MPMSKRPMLAALLLTMAPAAWAQGAPSAIVPPPVGGARDGHGCMSSTGASWSPLLRECIRYFERGIRLNPVAPEGSAILSAFAVFKGAAGSGPVEISRPKGAKVILPPAGKGRWKGSGLMLRHDAQGYALGPIGRAATYRSEQGR